MSSPGGEPSRKRLRPSEDGNGDGDSDGDSRPGAREKTSSPSSVHASDDGPSAATSPQGVATVSVTSNGQDSITASHDAPLTENGEDARKAPPPPQSAVAPPVSPSATAPSTTFEPSFFGVAPLDDFTREVGNWIWAWCAEQETIEDIEIEAKIGQLVDRSTGERVAFPVRNETILQDASNVNFVSNMTMNQHAAYNRLLNARVAECAQPSYHGHRIRYQHLHEVDQFYRGPRAGAQKVRVTRDERTGQVKPGGIVRKTRIADMNVFCPGKEFDYRISVNAEKQLTDLPTGNPVMSRRKDRLSYAHQLCNIDLTQVRDPEQKGPLHELEIEFRSASELLNEGMKTKLGTPLGQETPWGSYEDMIQVMLNNVRMIIRNAAPATSNR